MSSRDSDNFGGGGFAPSRRDIMKTSLGAAATGAFSMPFIRPSAAQTAQGAPSVRVTYLGGPTYLIEVDDLRIISDPGFDPQGTERIEGPGHTLTKVMAPPIPVDELGPIDIALVSHAQHLDNLDNEGRRLLGRVGQTFTTPESAEMGLVGNVRGLPTWETAEVTGPGGRNIRITAMPGIHTSNPDLRDAVGEVTGFMLEWDGQANGAFYVTGDTVYIDEMEQIAERYAVSAAILHLGRANVPAVGDNFLTMDGEQGARLVQLMDIRHAFPAHFEGWRHFTEGSWYFLRDFEAAGVSDRLHLLGPGESHDLSMS